MGLHQDWNFQEGYKDSRTRTHRIISSKGTLASTLALTLFCPNVIKEGFFDFTGGCCCWW